MVYCMLSWFVIVNILFLVLIRWFKLVMLVCMLVSWLFICLNLLFKYFVSLLNGFGVRKVVVMVVILLNMLNIGDVKLMNDVVVLNVVVNVFSFWRGLVFLVFLYFYFVVVMLLVFLINFVVIVDDVCSMLFKILYVGGLFFDVVCDLGLIWISFFLRSRFFSWLG